MLDLSIEGGSVMLWGILGHVVFSNNLYLVMKQLYLKTLVGLSMKILRLIFYVFSQLTPTQLNTYRR